MKGPQAHSSRVQWDGALVGTHQFGRVAFATAAQDNIGTFTAPCDLEIVKFLINVLASATSSTADIEIGTTASAAAYHGAYAIDGNAAGSKIDLDMTVATGKWTKKTMAKGEELKLKAAAATAVGSFSAALVYVPNEPSS